MSYIFYHGSKTPFRSGRPDLDRIGTGTNGSQNGWGFNVIDRLVAARAYVDHHGDYVVYEMHVDADLIDKHFLKSNDPVGQGNYDRVVKALEEIIAGTNPDKWTEIEPARMRYNEQALKKLSQAGPEITGGQLLDMIALSDLNALGRPDRRTAGNLAKAGIKGYWEKDSYDAVVFFDPENDVPSLEIREAVGKYAHLLDPSLKKQFDTKALQRIDKMSRSLGEATRAMNKNITVSPKAMEIFSRMCGKLTSEEYSTEYLDRFQSGTVHQEHGLDIRQSLGYAVSKTLEGDDESAMREAWGSTLKEIQAYAADDELLIKDLEDLQTELGLDLDQQPS